MRRPKRMGGPRLGPAPCFTATAERNGTVPSSSPAPPCRRTKKGSPTAMASAVPPPKYALPRASAGSASRRTRSAPSPSGNPKIWVGRRVPGAGG